jgi:Rrf2 family protein
MKLTSASMHALRALVYLARHGGEGLTRAHVIAAAEKLSLGFLGKSLQQLASAGVLYSVRGPNGGFRLARPPERVTLLEVLEAVDGPVRGEVPRVAVGDKGRLDARLQQACEQAADTVRRRLRAVTLADLAGRGGKRR